MRGRLAMLEIPPASKACKACNPWNAGSVGILGILGGLKCFIDSDAWNPWKALNAWNSRESLDFLVCYKISDT